MARGDLQLFEEFIGRLGDKEHDLDADVIKGMIITNTTPLANQTGASFSTYSANEVGEYVGGYSNGGVDINSTYSEADGVGTFDGDDIALTQNGSGFDDGYWLILYNDTNASKFAIGFLDLGGPISQINGPININWGSSIFTVTLV